MHTAEEESGGKLFPSPFLRLFEKDEQGRGNTGRSEDDSQGSGQPEEATHCVFPYRPRP